MGDQLHTEIHAVKKQLSDELDNRHETSQLTNAFAVIRHFERLGGLVYRLRLKNRPDDPVLESAEDFVAQASAQLMTDITPRRGGTYSAWVARYRRVWRQNTDLFLLTVCIFLSTGIIGWYLGATMPEYASAIIPQEFMERIIQHNKWFESLNDNPLMGGAQIAIHNMRVSMNTFLAGAILGLGGLYLIGFNGVHFGVVLGFCYANQFDRPLQEFVIGHGPLELSIIACAGFASTLFGRVFWMRPYSKFKIRMKEGMAEAGTVVVGVIPWLILAGIIEGGISPNPDITVQTKLTIGFMIAGLFWLWTLAPFTPTSQLQKLESK